MGKISSLLKQKCPRCGKGDLFEYNSYLPINKKPFEMKTFCPECGLKYEKEVGFFYGAMFVSYALSVALFVTCIIIYLLFFAQYSWWYFGAGYILVTLISTGLVFRYSRSIWVSAYIKYNPKAIDKRNLELIAEGKHNH